MLSRADILDAVRMPDPTALWARADAARRARVGRRVYLRALVECSNHCCRDCLYCGLRRSNVGLHRYRMSADELLACVAVAADQGHGTVVIQSGDDFGYTRDALANVIATIKARYPRMAITLSMGERPEDDYRAWRDAGADRYLMRHEAADAELYARLHPGQTWAARRNGLDTLRKLGFAVGAGFMVGVPGQTPDHLATDILFLQDFQPDMVGMGPFLPQKETPLGACPPGSVALTVRALALARLAAPGAYMPATTALATAGGEEGLVRGLQAGANVIMVNVTPLEHRVDYRIYDLKAPITEAMAEAACAATGRVLSKARGDPSSPSAD